MCVFVLKHNNECFIELAYSRERWGQFLVGNLYFEVWRSEKKVPQSPVRCPCLSFGTWLDLIGGCLN